MFTSKVIVVLDHMTMVTRVMSNGLLEQLNMMWCHVMSKTTMCDVHMDISDVNYINLKYLFKKFHCKFSNL
jgi:hypothetical protein